jgi:hypothetical protein
MGLKNDYFIIESLTKQDINDGKIFYDALSSIRKYSPIHKRVKTRKGFEKAITEFSKSDYRYLFISAHGDEENIELIDDSFNAYDLADLEIDLTNRRIFMSTCRGGSFMLAKYFIKKGAYSVVGSPDDLSQIVATGMWTTMALVFERLNESSLNFKELNTTLKLMSKIYQINLAYYSFIRNEQKMKGYTYAYKVARQRNDYLI